MWEMLDRDASLNKCLGMAGCDLIQKTAAWDSSSRTMATGVSGGRWFF
jgi:hypothetical protein